MNNHESTSLTSMIRRLFSFKNPSVKKFLEWKQCDDEIEFTELAVTNLVKKLRHHPGALENLEQALSSPGIPSKCITLTKNKEAAIREVQEGMLPHVIYCRIWRWGDLQSQHELKSIDMCENPYSEKSSVICINPYHYKRVEGPDLPSVLIPMNYQASMMSSQATFHQLNQPERMPMNMAYSDHHQFVEDSANNVNNFAYTKHHTVPHPSSQHHCNPSSQHHCNPSSQHHRNPYRPQSSTCTGEGVPISYVEPSYWASIAYYELNCRIGEKFNCAPLSVTVDGFTHYSFPNIGKQDRFSLGPLTNVRRIPNVDITRSHIGKGLRLVYTGGEVFAECLSDYPIFVQSTVCNLMNDLHPETVIKIHPGFHLKIFNNQTFAMILSNAVYEGFEAVMNLTKMCMIRISFIKGWGSSYNRHDVTTTPCWIEILLHGALQWLDRVITQMNGPANGINSVT